MMTDTPEVTNLFKGDVVEIMDEKSEKRQDLFNGRRKIYVRSLERNGVEGWINETDVDILEEAIW